MFLDVMLVDVFRDVAEQFGADLKAAPVVDNDVNGHFVSEQEISDFIHGNAKGLILRVAIRAGGNQRKSH